jgi:hypothetical protein
MSQSDREPPPSLDLRRDLHALRRVEPSPEFEARLGKALRDADRKRSQADQQRKPPRARPLPWTTWAVLAQATFAIALLIHFSDNEAEIERSQELTVQIPEDGQIWVPLRLETQHHEEGPTLQVHAPEGVEVSTHPVVEGGERRTVCRDATCTHRFTLPPPPHADPHVRVGIRTPGTYEIDVRHRSDEHSVRERFVVRAH